jgi:nicotinate dehydrogenase subunit A
MNVAQPLELLVNGQLHTLAVLPTTSLLHVLRNDLRLNGPKYGCGLGECGACTVLIGDRAARACCTPVSQVGVLPVTTLEGLEQDGVLDEVQRAFVQEQAAQCGYCLNGMIMTVRAALNQGCVKSFEDAKQALRFNLCRCGTHVEILRAACLACGVMLDDAS